MLFTVLLIAITVLKSETFSPPLFFEISKEVVYFLLCVLLNTGVSYIPSKILVCFP